LDTIENDKRDSGMCIGVWKIETSGGLGQVWPISNSLKEGEGKEKKLTNILEY